MSKKNPGCRGIDQFAECRIRDYLALFTGGALLETSLDGGALATVESNGLSLQGGLGYDVPLGRRLALSPQVTYVQTIGPNTEAVVEGQTVVAPGSPSYLTVGAALIWY